MYSVEKNTDLLVKAAWNIAVYFNTNIVTLSLRLLNSGMFNIVTEEQARSLIIRLFAKIEYKKGCYVWLGNHGRKGYGQITHGKFRKIQAHRIVFAAFNGKFDDKLCICHKCDNPPCINPLHLFSGTIKDNSIDMVKKGRHFCPQKTKIRCPKGHEYSIVNYKKTKRICKTCIKENRNKRRINTKTGGL